MSTDSSEKIEEVAGDWLARRDSGACSSADQAAFEAWINKSTLHRVAYLRLENAWEEARRLQALGAGVHSDRPPPPGQWNLTPFFEPKQPALSASSTPPRLYKRAEVRAALLAATLLIALAGTLYLRPGTKSYETSIGGVASVPMPDGSKITLNTDSQIDVALTETERRVELRHGEAFFEVAKDPDRPFVVDAGAKRVIAVGTKFSVRRERGDIRVVVTEGSVRVESQVLAAGTVASANGAGLLVQRRALAEAEEHLSWRSGVLVFRDSTLRDAAEEFNRYNARKIVIADAEVGALRVAGNFRTTNVDAFVRLLQQGYPVRTAHRGDEIVLSGR